MSNKQAGDDLFTCGNCEMHLADCMCDWLKAKASAPPPRTCTSCKATESKYWRGLKLGPILCANCYQREWLRSKRGSLKRKVYQFEGDA